MSRDFAGIFKGAGALGNFPCESSITAEAEAIRAAHLVCVEKGFLEVQVESDSKCPVGMINGSKFNMTLCSKVLLFDIQCLQMQLRSIEIFLLHVFVIRQHI